MIFKIRYPFDNSFQSSIIVEVRKPKLSRAFVYMKLVLGYPAYGPYMLFVCATSAAFESLPFDVYAVVFLFAHPLSFHSVEDGGDP